MKAVILAAGVGSRIRPLTDKTPKPLLKIGNKEILGRMLDCIIENKIKNVAIITGYKEDQIKKYVFQNYNNLNVEFIRNGHYQLTNTGYSLFVTKNFVKDDTFVKFDADVVFETDILKKLLKSPFENALCIDKNIHLDKEEVKVELNKDGRVLKVSKKLDPKKASGESIGIEKISSSASKILFRELEKILLDRSKWQEYYDDSYTTLVKKGLPFGAIDVSDLKWVEIDTHEDYARAQKLFSQD